MENKSSFLKDAIESITTLANKAKEPKTLEYNSHLYLIDEWGKANRIWEMKDTPEKKRVCSLDALVALIKHEAVDRYASNAHPLFVNCESFGSVTCYLSPDSGNYENRVTLYEAVATDVPGFRDSKWSLEEAMVALRSKFQHTDDVDYILGLIGRMDVNQQISSEDNGVTQTVQVRSGVSFVENQQVRPIVSLAPYRTFQEVLQPESDFVFRVDQDRKQNLFQSERVIIGKCPRCSENVYEGKKNFYCGNRSCQFVMWKNDRFFEQRKKAFTPKIAAALLKNGKAKVKGLYSEKTGKTYDATVLLADTGGKYVNYRVERKE